MKQKKLFSVGEEVDKNNSEVTKHIEKLSEIDAEGKLIIEDIRSVKLIIEDIRSVKSSIDNEYKKTKSEIKLCENINAKLRTYVSFEL